MNDVEQRSTRERQPGAAHAAEGGPDYVAFGIVAAAILLFVGTGSSIGPAVVRSLAGTGSGPDGPLLNAFLLNIALIIFGWSRYRALVKEVNLRRSAERQARVLAETDPLTGLLNRRSFDEAVDALIADAGARGRAVAVLMIDLDNFKQINDFHGHAAGDRLLVETGDRIRHALPAHALVGRFGGDEFAAALAVESGRVGEIERDAARLVEAIGRPILVDSAEIATTPSIGIARSDSMLASERHETQARGLLEMADIAMYHAKRQGRNGCFWFEATMADELRFRAGIEAGIRAGIPAGEFVPYYEQQIDLTTGEITGFEMLARWESPEFGLVSPDVFIPVAEDIGAIADLSESVIRQALDDARGWDASLTLAVNISPVQLRDPWFSQKLLKLLVSANFPPHRLEIEITESCLHTNVSQVRSLITSLKNQGIRISLDDFGTGYSSLAQLSDIPFDRIKIDRSFVTNLLGNRDSEAIVDSIAMLGKGLNLPITAEGIETSEVLEHLRKYGELKGQGYLYGRPRPAAETRAWLDERGLVAARPDEATPMARPIIDKRSQTG